MWALVGLVLATTFLVVAVGYVLFAQVLSMVEDKAVDDDEDEDDKFEDIVKTLEELSDGRK